GGVQAPARRGQLADRPAGGLRSLQVRGPDPCDNQREDGRCEGPGGAAKEDAGAQDGGVDPGGVRGPAQEGQPEVAAEESEPARGPGRLRAARPRSGRPGTGTAPAALPALTVAPSGLRFAPRRET